MFGEFTHSKVSPLSGQRIFYKLDDGLLFVWSDDFGWAEAGNQAIEDLEPR